MTVFYAKRILIVEDDAATAKALTYRLESWGFRTFSAQSGKKAFEIAAEHPVELVILDLGLPDISGLEVCTELRNKYGPWLPILMLTGMDKSTTQLNSFGHGADAYLTKPYNPEELLTTIKYLLGSATAPIEKNDKPFLTIEEVAQRFGINVTTVYRLAQRGSIPAFKVGSQWRFSSDKLDSWSMSRGGRSESHDIQKNDIDS